MAKITSLKKAVAEFVSDNSLVALEGFTHLIPYAAGHEIIRQGIKELTLVRMTPDVIYDQMIGAGCVKKLIFSWGGNPGVGSLHRFRDAVEKGWPKHLAIEEHAHADMANAYEAGAANLPFAVFRGYYGSDIPKYTDTIRFINCPFTGEKLAAVASIRPDTTIIHAQKADKKGNVLLWGITGVQKQAVLAAKNVIVTVEEIVEKLDAKVNQVVLPHWIINAVCEVPRGATPSYAEGYYSRDNIFYKSWDAVSRDRASFSAWIRRNILNTRDFAEYLSLYSALGSAENE
jgi:glutaconate CoA-transferase subunit A